MTPKTCPPCHQNCAQGHLCAARHAAEDRGYIVTLLLACIALAVPFWTGVWIIAKMVWDLVL